MEGGRAGGRRKVGIRELEGRKVGGERRKDGGRGREEGGEAEWRTKVGVRELEGRKLGGGRREGGYIGGSRDEEGEEGMEGEEWRREGGTEG